MKNNTVPASAKSTFNLVAVYENLLGRYWIPTGFFIFLSGFFWIPTQHNYKVVVSYASLLPSLLSMLTFRRWREWFKTPLVPLLFLYFAYMIVMAALRGADPVAFAQWSFYIVVFVFGISAQMRIEPATLHKILAAAVFAAAAAAIYAIVIDARSGLLWQAEYRLVGYATLYNPLKSGHLFGAFVVIGIWSGFVERRLRWLSWLAAAICTLTVLLTGSRAPCIALLVVSAWNIFGLCRGRERFFMLIKLTIIAVAAAFLFWHKLSERGMSLRPEVWNHAFSLSLKNFWFGVGLGSRLDIPMSVGGHLYDTHNVLLAVFYYGGIVGVLLFVLAFGASFSSAWQKRFSSPIFLLAASLQLYGLATLQFDGGSLIGRPTEYWILYWAPMALYLYAVFRDNKSSAINSSTKPI
jgi:hypothetical protein